MKIFSVDAETDGLYGEVWAIGATVLEAGKPIRHRFGAQIDRAVVTDEWTRTNVVPVVDLPRFSSREDLLNGFWAFWLTHKSGADCIADVGDPVESGLFRACVELDIEARRWEGPYPRHELATALLMAGVDPDVDRRVFCGRSDLVPHDPVDDSLASALCWQLARTRAT